MDCFIRKEAAYAMTLLEEAGYHAYLVGGCVRDFMLHREPKDWDITTDATPQQIIECFSQFSFQTIGMKHGTITVNFPFISLEITTHRIDGTYHDHRRPDQVSYTSSLAEDLQRRDFTINAMACDLRGRLYDYYEGKEDLQKKIIRCVGQSDERFTEDALRMLRALRFSAQLGFSIEESTKESIHKNALLLQNISKERITMEFEKMINGDYMADVLPDYGDIWSVFLPIKFDKKRLIAAAIDMQKAPKDFVTRLCCFFYAMTKDEHSTPFEKKRGEFLKFISGLSLSKKKIEECQEMWNLYNRELPKTKSEIKNILSMYSVESWLKYENYLKSIQHPCADFLERVFLEIQEKHECYRIKDLKVNGKDILAIGFTSGKEVGDILQQLLRWVILFPENNTKEKLIDYVRQQYIMKTSL